MKNNVKPAVAIIAALSLLLGLSLGKIQQQHQEIEALAQRTNVFKIGSVCTDLFAWEKELEASHKEVEEIKKRMRKEREAQLRELHEQVERVRKMYQR